MKELNITLRLAESHWLAILAAIRHSCAPEVVESFSTQLDWSRDGELQVRANWEMGIVQDCFDRGDESE